MGDLLSDLPPAQGKEKCPVGIVLKGGVPGGSSGEALDRAEQDQLLGLLADPGVESTRISRLLTERRKLACSENAVQRHRRGACQCP